MFAVARCCDRGKQVSNNSNIQQIFSLSYVAQLYNTNMAPMYSLLEDTNLKSDGFILLTPANHDLQPATLQFLHLRKSTNNLRTTTYNPLILTSKPYDLRPVSYSPLIPTSADGELRPATCNPPISAIRDPFLPLPKQSIKSCIHCLAPKQSTSTPVSRDTPKAAPYSAINSLNISPRHKEDRTVTKQTFFPTFHNAPNSDPRVLNTIHQSYPSH
jgi:hypothetical protein